MSCSLSSIPLRETLTKSWLVTSLTCTCIMLIPRPLVALSSALPKYDNGLLAHDHTDQPCQRRYQTTWSAPTSACVNSRSATTATRRPLPTLRRVRCLVYFVLHRLWHVYDSPNKSFRRTLTKLFALPKSARPVCMPMRTAESIIRRAVRSTTSSSPWRLAVLLLLVMAQGVNLISAGSGKGFWPRASQPISLNKLSTNIPCST